jgi:hypothetical protein
LPESCKLDIPNGKADAVTLTEWITQASRKIVQCGMDGVFYVRKDFAAATTEWINILDEWTAKRTTEVIDWLNNETFDEWDHQNLLTSGDFLVNSITPALLRKIQTTLNGRQDGPLVFSAIVREHQYAGASAVRALIKEVESLSLAKEGGEDVQELARKIHVLGRRISGLTKRPPDDFAGVVAGCFLECSTMAFTITATDVHKRAEANDLSWEDALQELEEDYISLKQKKKWVAAADNKEQKQIKALTAKVNQLESQLKMHGTSQKSSSANSSNKDSSEKSGNPHANYECHRCHKKGHIAANCPEKSSAESKPPAADVSKSEGEKSKRKMEREAPKDGESHKKTMFGTEYWWCAKCKRWTKGDKKHTTEQHKSKKPESDTGASASLAMTGTQGLVMTGFQ